MRTANDSFIDVVIVGIQLGLHDGSIEGVCDGSTNGVPIGF